MASVQKFTDKVAVSILRHCNREIKNDKNKDIDKSRTHLNYSLTPNRNVSDLEYYRQRKSELYCYGRYDVKTLAGWIITAPKNLSEEEEKIFFEKTYEFLEQRYGEKNVINATVHRDEGKAEKQKDRWGTVKDENGNEKTFVLGQAHLHFNFIPVAERKATAKHKETEKICANDVLNKRELQHFHSDLQKYLKENGIAGADEILNGKTKQQGGNRSVADIKKIYELEKENERLRERLREREIERTTRW